MSSVNEVDSENVQDPQSKILARPMRERYIIYLMCDAYR